MSINLGHIDGCPNALCPNKEDRKRGFRITSQLAVRYAEYIVGAAVVGSLGSIAAIVPGVMVDSPEICTLEARPAMRYNNIGNKARQL